ncbi:MAG: HdeD family acid-resistance protein [Lachnospiraceae bacterium]
MKKAKEIKTCLPQVVWLLSGIFLGVAALLSFASSGEKLIRIAPWLGLSMLATGIVNVILYFFCMKQTPGAKWLLADSITAALLSIFPLFNQITSAAAIPIFFCVWDLFSGILRMMESTEQKATGEHGWRWFYVVGVIEILTGCIALIKPVEEALTMHVTVGFVLLIQAIAFFHKASVKLKYIK